MNSKASHQSLKGEFTRKLSRYTAFVAGGVAGTIAGFESTEAALIKTASGVSLVNNPGPTPQAMIDLNNDGTDDVMVTVATASILSAQGLNGASLAGVVGGFKPGGSFFYPTALQASNHVHTGMVFSGGAMAALNTFGTLANGTGGTLAPAAGNWMDDPNAVTGFMGVRFEIAGNTHYGWVHITWDPNADTATIIDYAYQSDPGVPAHVPEPSTLALLAMGVAGLATRRRRKM